MTRARTRLEHVVRCAVCLREGIVLSAGQQSPIRHGFSAINVQHGASGGWHTGPCDGVRYAHFGQSTEGTTFELARTEQHLSRVRAQLDHLATRPELPWHFAETLSRDQVARGAEPHRATYTLTPIDAGQRKVTYRTAGAYGSVYTVPSYERHRGTLVVLAESNRDTLVDWRGRLVAAIAGWAPVPPAPRSPEVPVVHRPREYIFSGGVTIRGPACRRPRGRVAAEQKLLSDDSALVTCGRCRG